MLPWCEDFSSCTLQDVLASQEENRAWSKELRRRTSALVTSRLANEITRADYLDRRSLAQREATECRRRATILDAQIRRTLLVNAPPQA